LDYFALVCFFGERKRLIVLFPRLARFICSCKRLERMLAGRPKDLPARQNTREKAMGEFYCEANEFMQYTKQALAREFS
jgi:hypothetical protein